MITHATADAAALSTTHYRFRSLPVGFVYLPVQQWPCHLGEAVEVRKMNVPGASAMRKEYSLRMSSGDNE